MTTKTGQRYRIAEVGALTGFSTPTLRYYEEIGLMPPAERTAAGYRMYGNDAIERLRFISRAKSLGCSLEEITELAVTWDNDVCAPVQHRLRALVGTKLREAEAQIDQLHAFADELRATATVLARQPVDGPCDDTCGCVTDPASADATATVPISLGKSPAPAVGSEAPIACSLDLGDLRKQLDDWGDLLQSVSLREQIPGGLRLTFDAGASIAELASLSAKEQGCCPFFGFAITIDHRGTALEVTAPADEQDLLAAAFGDAS